MASSARSRSVSHSVPAPPPPSPYACDLGDFEPGIGLRPSFNLDELLLLLCRKADVSVPGPHSWLADSITPDPVSVSANAKLPTSVLSPVASEDVLAARLAKLAGNLDETGLLTLPILGKLEEAPTAATAGPGVDSGVSSVNPSLLLPSYDLLHPLCQDGAATDAGDESLQKYKASLGLGAGKDLSDPNDPRVCIIQSLTMEALGRDPVKIDLSVQGSEATLKDHPFTIKEGARFTMVATFKVQHEVLSGLCYVQVIKRKGVRVSKDSEMIGSYAPNTDKQPVYTKRFHEDEAPSGMLARGHYVANSSFVDDDKKTHLSFEWSFDISKDW